MSDHYLDSLLGEQEKILLITRQHWFVLVKAIIVEIILAVLIVVGVIILSTTTFPPAIFGLGLLVIPVVSFVMDYLNWANRKYVVTSRRVMQLSGVFNKNVIDSSLEKVNDVKMEQSALGRIFEYGDIDILTASELAVNKFTIIGDPIRFKTAMLNAKALLEREPFRLDGEDIPDNIPALIEKLDELRKQGILSEEEFHQKKIDLLAKL